MNLRPVKYAWPVVPTMVTALIWVAITARLAAARQRDPRGPLSALLADASNESLGVRLTYSEEALAEILSPRHFVNVRRTLGGPAPEQTTRAAAASRGQLDDDQMWWRNATDALTSAERRLAQRSAAL